MLVANRIPFWIRDHNPRFFAPNGDTIWWREKSLPHRDTTEIPAILSYLYSPDGSALLGGWLRSLAAF